jgi:hypothetical protein
LDKININSDLIDEFRNKVNEEPFFREKYRNVNGKNYWNIICSAMDWISVASEGLTSIKLNTKGFGVNHLETLNLMQYIITVDILVESIIQLYRVIDGSKSYPLFDSNEIFKHPELSDDKYFKHIRAVFGIHPVNLNSLDGVKRHDGEKFYASWVARNGIDDDFHVFLYSNNPEKDNLYSFGINIKDINLYAEKRYNLLTDLISKVDLHNQNHINHFRNSIISTNTNPVEQLRILFEENNKRFGTNYGYGEIIRYCYRLLKVDISSLHFDDFDMEIIHEYRRYLISLIPEIMSGLQDMTWKDIGFDLCYLGYEFEKIYSYLIDEEHPIGKAYFNELIRKGPLPINLSTSDDFNLKQLVLDSYLYKETTRLGRPITFEEMIIKPENY